MIERMLPGPPEPGQIVRVRQRQYLVEDVQPPPEHGEATLVLMSCLDDDALGDALEVFGNWKSTVKWCGRRGTDPVGEILTNHHGLPPTCMR